MGGATRICRGRNRDSKIETIYTENYTFLLNEKNVGRKYKILDEFL